MEEGMPEVEIRSIKEIKGGRFMELALMSSVMNLLDRDDCAPEAILTTARVQMMAWNGMLEPEEQDLLAELRKPVGQIDPNRVFELNLKAHNAMRERWFGD